MDCVCFGDHLKLKTQNLKLFINTDLLIETWKELLFCVEIL